VSRASVRACVVGAIASVVSCAPRADIGHIEPGTDVHPVFAAAAHEESKPVVPRGRRQIGACARPGRFTVAHINDLQARWSERIDGKSRYAYVAGYLRALAAEVPETIVLDAGDDYEKGALADLRSMGEATRRMIQALPIDVRTIGNHDFAYGLDAVLKDVGESAHPVLAANVARADGTSPFASFARFDVGCVKVGVTGLVTRGYGSDDRPTEVPYFGVLEQNPRYAEVVEKVVREHRGEVDVMIAVDHIGLFEDASLAARVSGVDLVVGAHTEDTTARPIYVGRRDGSHAFVVQAGHYGRAVGRLDLVVKERGLYLEKSEIVPITAKSPVAEDVAELARTLEEEYAPDDVVGWTQAEIKRGRPMAELVARAAREVWGVDAAVVGADLFWDGLPAGPLTLQRMFDTVLVQWEPSGTSGFSSLWFVELGGADLLALRARRAVFASAPIVPGKTYKVAIEKRALENLLPKVVSARFGGEMIDVLEAYARARAARGLPID
jgi:2',3'-cyclic-nucleotide 2'-phosphodiesterase (5'-nucleotidase family)